MSTCARRARRSGWSRREVLRGAALLAGALVLPRGGARAREEFRLPDATREALGSSPLVYVSPLHPDGKESSCHGEVWFFEDRGDAVIATGVERWKSRALRKGWDEARVWVGDFGPVGKAAGRFREAPTFRARAQRDSDRASFDRLLQAFGRKYPEGWGKWEPRFEREYAEGSRVVIRYRPIGA